VAPKPKTPSLQDSLLACHIKPVDRHFMVSALPDNRSLLQDSDQMRYDNEVNEKFAVDVN
jgi:hypothetical protein